MTKKQELEQWVKTALNYLVVTLNYQQTAIVRKLDQLGLKLGLSTLNNATKGKQVGINTLKTLREGLEQLLKNELGIHIHPGTFEVEPINDANWQPQSIPEKKDPNEGFQLMLEGRFSLAEKLDFISTATHEIIEIGIRLNKFALYFEKERPSAFKKPVIDLLKRGVHFKSYLIDHNSTYAMMYFDDRAKVLTSEKDARTEIPKVINSLQAVAAEFSALQLPGKFEVYSYKKIPYCLMQAVDPTQPYGKIMVSHYLYGIKRADCPTITVYRQQQPTLFMTYWKSMQMFMQDAECIISS
jgi:hypothetical protein